MPAAVVSPGRRKPPVRGAVRADADGARREPRGPRDRAGAHHRAARRVARGEKALAQDAAVIGRVFWIGALAASRGDDRWTVDERLHALERKAFVRRHATPRSSARPSTPSRTGSSATPPTPQSPGACAREKHSGRRLGRVARTERGSRGAARAPLRERARPPGAAELDAQLSERAAIALRRSRRQRARAALLRRRGGFYRRALDLVSDGRPGATQATARPRTSALDRRGRR